MNTNKPDQEQEIAALIGKSVQSARTVQPSPELLHATLAKIRTPLLSERYGMSFFFSKAGAFVTVAALVLVVGGVAFVQNNNSTSSVNPTSDTALASDAAQIDNQLSGLATDNTQTDQVLDRYQPSQF